MPKRHFWRSAIAIGGAIAALNAVPASASVINVRSALIAQSDAPTGFTQSHTYTTKQFRPVLSVLIRAGQSELSVQCTLDPSFQSFGWTQGMIEAFDHTSALAALQVCASLFRTPVGAASAYHFLLQRDVAMLVKLKIATRLTMSKIGNQSAGMVRQIKECSCSTTALLRTYVIVYRHENAVVESTYTGPARYTPDNFARLVSGQNRKLR